MDIYRILEILTPIVVTTIPVLVSVLTSHSKTKKQIGDLCTKLNQHIKEAEDDNITQARRRILHFADEIYQGVKHSENYFEDILDDIDTYERYCKAHTDYANNKGKLAMDTIKKIYAKCQRDHSFLK